MVQTCPVDGTFASLYQFATLCKPLVLSFVVFLWGFLYQRVLMLLIYTDRQIDW